VKFGETPAMMLRTNFNIGSFFFLSRNRSKLQTAVKSRPPVTVIGAKQLKISKLPRLRPNRATMKSTKSAIRIGRSATILSIGLPACLSVYRPIDIINIDTVNAKWT